MDCEYPSLSLRNRSLNQRLPKDRKANAEMLDKQEEERKRKIDEALQ